MLPDLLRFVRGARCTYRWHHDKYIALDGYTDVHVFEMFDQPRSFVANDRFRRIHK